MAERVILDRTGGSECRDPVQPWIETTTARLGQYEYLRTSGFSSYPSSDRDISSSKIYCEILELSPPGEYLLLCK